MKLSHAKHVLFAAITSVLLIGCSSVPSPLERYQTAQTLVSSRGWIITRLDAAGFDLLTSMPKSIMPDRRLTIYIEGDGLAWLSSSTPSPDPTPRNPLALRLALAQTDGNAAYIARPCQYIDARQNACPQRYWTQARFAPETIQAMDRAINKLKSRFGAENLVLVGYSGGGAVAALVAARRDDVVKLITVAGNLDHAAWTRYHHLAPLMASLNAADVAQGLAKLPQTHFIGGKDRVIPASLSMNWPVQVSGDQGSNITVVPNFDHACCWVREWPRLLKEH